MSIGAKTVILTAFAPLFSSNETLQKTVRGNEAKGLVQIYISYDQ